MVKGNPVILPKVNPAAWWKFDEGKTNKTKETVSKVFSKVTGSKTLWRKGVSGTALQFDGYYSEINLSAKNAPKVTDAITIESWVALGAYPWSDVPIVQQLDDSPEVLIANNGKD